jgi:predicted metal-dependent hydrolase
MNTRLNQIVISNQKIDVIRKDIKNIRLSVFPPNGKTRVFVPLDTSKDHLRIFLISKTSWIKKQKKQFSRQERQKKPKYQNGEIHYLFGKKYILCERKMASKSKIVIHKNTIDLFLKPKTSFKQKQNLFENFYRYEFEQILPKYIKKWQKKIGVEINETKIRKMRTKWGTCNNKDKRIWLNLELVKKPLHCIDYVIAHEFVHLIERTHTEKFLKILGKVYPKWEITKEELNQGMLGYFEWGCKSNSKLKNVIGN